MKKNLFFIAAALLGFAACQDPQDDSTPAFKGTTYTWNEERDYLYPVPVGQRILTGGALSQNPGWVDTYKPAE